MNRSSALIWCAGLLGLLNAAPSYYWAFGGDALLESIGQWLIELRTDMPVLTSLALFGIAVGKTLAAGIPFLAAHQLPGSGVQGPDVQGPDERGPALQRSSGLWSRAVLWWNLSRLIAAGLIIYGAAGLLINAGLLLWPGLELQDPTARLGQALIWYPMLLVWGLVLAAGLRRLRATAAA